ncbi:MAG: beta-propeller domain-containing protein [Candidatus Diapherotrites archaeon]
MKHEKGFSGMDIAIMAIAGLLIAAGLIAVVAIPGPIDNTFEFSDVPKFESCSAIKTAFEDAQDQGYRGYGGEMMLDMMVPTMSATSEKSFAESADSAGSNGASATPNYSETNVQVQGVDEADIVKTDGKYIYTITRNKLTISKAYPAEDAEVLSVTDLKNLTPNEMFIEDDVVLVFGSYYDEVRTFEQGQTGVTSKESQPGVATSEMAIAPDMMPYPYYNRNLTRLQLWDISDRENPKLERTVDFEGSYLTSRKIDDIAYFVINTYPSYYYGMAETADDETILPVFRDTKQSDEFTAVSRCVDVGYLQPIQPNNFVTVGSISMKDLDKEVKKETVVASGQNVYASANNLYLAEVDYQYPEPIPLVDDIMPVQRWEVKQVTNVHKFALKNGSIAYQGMGSAPGNILNQFSMDEYDDHFRIATTIGNVSRAGGGSANNIYVFDDEMNRVGALEDLAPGEEIYSMRFMGKKGYMVTFKKIDPLFVIDLSDHTNPKVLGKLKIPGYSDYLHPFDETHIIGVGKAAVEAEGEWGDFAWYQGIKIALFDVSDVENPKEMYQIVIGDRGTDSYALNDHKAFLFDREKELLVLPITLAEINEAQYGNEIPDSAYGDFVYQGAYVYKLSLEDGFELIGRITHYDDEDIFKKSGYYYYGEDYSVKRSLYIGDVLYTVSDAKILANNLSDLDLIKELRLLSADELNTNEYNTVYWE